MHKCYFGGNLIWPILYFRDMFLCHIRQLSLFGLHFCGLSPNACLIAESFYLQMHYLCIFWFIACILALLWLRTKHSTFPVARSYCTLGFYYIQQQIGNYWAFIPFFSQAVVWCNNRTTKSRRSLITAPFQVQHLSEGGKPAQVISP